MRIVELMAVLMVFSKKMKDVADLMAVLMISSKVMWMLIPIARNIHTTNKAKMSVDIYSV